MPAHHTALCTPPFEHPSQCAERCMPPPRIPVWRAEHRSQPGGSPARLSGGAADAPFRDGPDFREAQGTRRARRPGRLSFPPFLWRDKEKGSGAG